MIRIYNSVKKNVGGEIKLKKLVSNIYKMLLILVVVLVLMILVIIVICANTLTKNNRDLGSHQVEMKVGEGDKKAVVIYQPAAMSNVMEKATEGITEGLNQTGYDVLIDYCGEHIESDLSEYDVIVYGAPAYAGHASKILVNTVSRVKNYTENQKVCVFSVGMMDTTTELDDIVNKVNGVVNKTKKFKASDEDIQEQSKKWASEF